MGLKLKSTGGTGSVQLNCPDNHNLNTSFTLPTTNVTGGEFVLADGSGNVNIDSGTLYVDAVNNRVGIGNTSPDYNLTVANTSSYVIQNLKSSTTEFCGIYFGDTDAAGRGTIVYDNNVDAMSFRTNGSGEDMRIDSSGRVGIGTTAPNYPLTVKTSNTSTVHIWAGGTTFESRLFFGDDDSVNRGSIIYDHNTDSMRLSINGSERARIDSSGRLLVGTTSGSIDFQVKTSGGFQVVNAGEIALRYNAYYDGTDKYIQAANKASSLVMNGSGEFRFYSTNTASTSAGSSITGWTERMRIFSNGRATHGSTAGSGGEAFNVFGANGELRVLGNGNVQNTNNSYGQISDVKLKENIVDASSQWTDVKGLRVVNFNFKEETGYETHKQIGFIAQEVEEVSPGLVYEISDYDKDGNDLGTVTKSVNYSVLYMKAVKALQEAMERIETLEAINASFEARLTALEGGQP